MTEPTTDVDQSDGRAFDHAFERAAMAAAHEWAYAIPQPDFYRSFDLRVPPEIRDEIAQAIADGVVTVEGARFQLPRLATTKGPYAFFSRNRGSGVPAPNWEYFVQLAEYTRLVRVLSSPWSVGFEDGLMDVSVRHHGRLIWYIEAKEQAAQAQHLIEALAAHADAVDISAEDRGNDPLRKAKYLVQHRPTFLSVVAIGFRRDFAVQYPREFGFELVPLAEAPKLGDPRR